MVLGLWEAEDIGVVSMKGYKVGGIGVNSQIKLFNQVSRCRKGITLLAYLYSLRYRLVAFSESLKYESNFSSDV